MRKIQWLAGWYANVLHAYDGPGTMNPGHQLDALCGNGVYREPRTEEAACKLAKGNVPKCKKCERILASMPHPDMNSPKLAPAVGSASFWWMPRRTDPMRSGWYYVREVQPRLCVGVRYFDDSDQSWWAVSKDAGLVPNETFHDWLTIPNISDRQRS